MDASNQESEETEGIVHTTGMTEQGQKVRILGLVGSPLYIALHLKQYEEAKQILEQAPQTAEPGYAVRQFRVTFPSGKPEECEIEFLAGGVVYLEEILLTDAEIPDDLCIKLWNIWSLRDKEDAPDLFVEGGEGNEVPLLIREWPCRVRSRRKHGDLKYTGDRWWYRCAHFREEYEPFKEAAQADLEQFWKGLKGLYRLRTLDRSLYETCMDEKMAAHLILKFMFIIFQLVLMENVLHLNQSEDPPLEPDSVESLLWHARRAASDDRMLQIHHINQLKLAVDGAEALRKLKKGLEKLGVTYISGDALWDACMDYHYSAYEADTFWPAFQIWKAVFEGKLILTMDGMRKERSDQIWSVLLYEIKETNGTCPLNCSYKLEILRYLDGLQWTENEGTKWLENKRHTSGKIILGENDRELLLLALEKNVFLREDIDFLWENDCEEGHLQLKPLLLMKKYGCLQ